MTAGTEALIQAFRLWVTDNVPASGANWPNKTEIIAALQRLAVDIGAAQAGLHTEPTIAARDTYYATPENRDNLVYVNNNNGSASDPANGVYEYVSGAARLAQGFYAGVAAVVQPLVDDAVGAAGFPLRSDALTFAPKMATGEQTVVYGEATNATRAAVAGEVRLDGTAATVGEQIPLNGRYTKQASGSPALLRTGSLDNQLARVQADAAATSVSFATAKNASLSTIFPWVDSAVSVVAGSYVNASDGSTASNSGFKVGTVALTGNEFAVRITTRMPSGAAAGIVAGVAYFDGAGAHLGNELVSTGSTASYIDRAVTPPAAARSMKITGAQGSEAFPLTVQTRPIGTIPPHFTDLFAANTSWVRQAVTVVPNQYYQVANQLPTAPAANSSYSSFAMPLTGQEIAIRASGITNASGAALAIFYDAAGTRIRVQSVGTGAPVTHTNELLDVPSAARTVAITSYVGAVPSIDFLTITQVATSLSSLAASTSNNSVAIATVNATLAEWQTPTQAGVVGSYINPANGAVQTGASGYHYIKIPITGQEVGLRASGYIDTPNIALAVYYDAANVFISAEFVGPSSGFVQYTDQVLSPPANARYVATTSRISGGQVSRIQTKTPGQNIATRLQAQEARSAGLGTTDLCQWGDSMTAGPNTGSSDGYSNVLPARYPSRTAYDQGISGQTTPMIAARMGAIPTTASASFTIPTSGSVAIASPSPSLLSLVSGSVVIKVLVKGVLCALSAAYSGGVTTYTLTPIVYPNAPVAVASGDVIKVLSGFVSGSNPTNCVALGTLLSGVVLIRAGRNDVQNPTDIATYLSQVDAMVQQARKFTDKIVVMGVTNGSHQLTIANGGDAAYITDAISYVLLSVTAAINAALGQLYAGIYIDPQANHVANGGAEAKVAGGVTFQVLTPSAATVIIKADGVHENTAGQNQTADLIVSAITARGL